MAAEPPPGNETFLHAVFYRTEFPYAPGPPSYAPGGLCGSYAEVLCGSYAEVLCGSLMRSYAVRLFALCGGLMRGALCHQDFFRKWHYLCHQDLHKTLHKTFVCIMPYAGSYARGGLPA